MNTERLRAYSQLSADENRDTQTKTRELCLIETQLFEAQKMLKDDLEAVKRHLFAQTKSVEAFNRTITLLERERSQQFNKIRAFQEELCRLGQVVDRQNQDSQLEKRFQVLSQELSRKLLFLRGLIEQRTTHRLQTPLPGCSPGLPLCDSQQQEALNDITQEISESKKFLWEEMEAIRAEIDDIKQNLSNPVKLIWGLFVLSEPQEESWVRGVDDNKAGGMGRERCGQNKERLTDGCQSSLHNEEREQEITALRSAIVELQEQIRILLVSKNMPTRVRERRRRQRKLVRRVLAAGSTTGESEDSDIGRAFGLAPESEGLSSSAEDMNRAGQQQP
ncbi:coiled-coil domain-containing protein 159-like [Acipenser oxyrinchus oxyrinchus]|uniref:Coiled-coil domain-containing protein 159-like n=1 Tax=Acipenser oxyrinchus oxyrinchus TaxID=40147 RepID=A0AAD8CLM9_ACIOX|nr:coiled-coil domain-containing protein 159-like [Acipenser oxyrinchus oxyrinchus]